MARPMKESGLSWIGEIPEHWEIKKAKRIFKKERRPVINQEIVTVFRDGEVTQRKNRRTEGFTMAEKEHGYQGVEEGDLVIHAMDAFAGAIGVSDSPGKCSPVCTVCTPIIESDNHYYAFLLRTYAISGYIESLATGIRERSSDFRYSTFSNSLLITPPIHEQKKIVDFVIRKHSQIDSIINNTKESIIDLKKYKQSVIAEAVTKGLNSDSKLIESGVEWIGGIPEHWRIVKLKTIMTKKKELCLKYEKQNILSLTVNGVIVRDLDNPKGKMPATFDGYQKVYRGNLLLCLFDIDVTPRCVGLIEHDGLTSPAYSQYELKENAYPKFYEYFLTYLDDNKILLHLTRSLRNTLPDSDFGVVKTVLPPLKEQQQICDYLNRKCSQIDNLIIQKQQLIKEFDSYKKSLTFEYVTGKKEVL